MENQNIEKDVFDENVEPEMMCVGQACSSPILQRKVAADMLPPNSVLSRRFQSNPERHIIPLKIDIEKDVVLPKCADSDDRLDDVFDSPDGQGPGLERLYSLAFEDFDDISGEAPENNDDSRNGTLTLPIAIPSPGIDTHRHRHFESFSEASEFASTESSLATSFSSGLRRRTSSVSLTVYQWSRLRAAAYEDATSVEGLNHPDMRRGLGLRSISGSCLPSPSRSIATQTPTEHFSFEFPFQRDRDVTDRRNVRPSSSWSNDCVKGKNRSLMSILGGILGRQSFPNDTSRYTTSVDWAEEVGQDLRTIADDLERSRNRSFSLGQRRSSS